MATPMTPDQWRAQLKKFGVPFREVGDFAKPTSGRDDETGLVFGPVYGVGIHHTGSDGSDAINRDLIDRGRSDLPGPLAHAGLNDDGVIDLITWKRANHFGGGDPDVLAAVRAESYGDYPPHTDKHQGESGAVDGNDSFYGLEVYYSGGHAMTVVQYKSAVGWAAAICDFHGWSAKSTIGHKEWSDWKVDPGHVDMKTFRAHVQQRIDAARTNQPVPVQEPKVIPKSIRDALAANIAYEKAVIKAGEAQKKAADEAAVLIPEIRKQRRALRNYERKVVA